ncbi:hypothetical protein J6590_087831 [Homalodisca vitripennis]|nr:hypothetical protein J6590_087831 [Homalodisca vitripennis]
MVAAGTVWRRELESRRQVTSATQLTSQLYRFRTFPCHACLDHVVELHHSVNCQSLDRLGSGWKYGRCWNCLEKRAGVAAAGYLCHSADITALSLQDLSMSRLP